MKRTALARHTPLARTTPLRARKHPEVRIGKVTGRVRLSGDAMRKLRMACWIRDLCTCVDCGVSTLWTPRFDGDPQAYDMAHVRSRGAGGSDSLDNVLTKCHSCHLWEHTKGIDL